MRANTPEEVLVLLSIALGEGRVADAASLYEPDAVFFYSPNTGPVTGRDEIRSALADLAAIHPVLRNDVLRTVIAGNIATVVNAWRIDGTRPDGQPIAMSATSTDVMRRRTDGSWGILIDDPWGVQPRK
ncbi:YybH family protein [Nocardia sp. CDC160]|uniref:YybH family protein n=1 Tax=Nocardia sp. CDC160 TaxID=3112166 RepID=UPI002DB6AFB4|nr:nuclear transport factor 2 family protein [Nocardia sp. CDC160]MEC3914911.1 nuclear transport factor 2 family protein [Nocardia sp. CDC160]